MISQHYLSVREATVLEDEFLLHSLDGWEVRSAELQTPNGGNEDAEGGAAETLEVSQIEQRVVLDDHVVEW